jgi:hypothetical protein
MATNEPARVTIDVLGMESVVACVGTLAGACGEAIRFIEHERRLLFDSISLSDGTVPEADDRAELAKFDAFLRRLHDAVATAAEVLKPEREGDVP